MAQILIEKGSGRDIEREDLPSAFWEASTFGRVKIVQFLIEKGVGLSSDTHRSLALIEAFFNARDKMVRALLAQKGQLRGIIIKHHRCSTLR